MELLHAYQRLSNNADFKKLVLKGFCAEEVLNLNRQASRELTAESKQAKSQQAQAGPVLEAFLTRVELEGQQALELIPKLEAMSAEEEE